MFEQYRKLRQGPRYEKCRLWGIAIGLQAVDRLEVSGFLVDAACRHIEGEITMQEVLHLVDDHYGALGEGDEPDRQEEADKVASRISALLAEDAAAFTPETLRGIHERLFRGLYDHAGTWRQSAIAKGEWVLGGESVGYTHPSLIRPTLEYDFNREAQFRYSGLSRRETALHAAEFISGIWQIHPFREGNTRTTAVFCIQYLRHLGFQVDNAPFELHSWYFRNALVRANYSNPARHAAATKEYLNRFFENMLLNGSHELRNDDLLLAD